MRPHAHFSYKRPALRHSITFTSPFTPTQCLMTIPQWTITDLTYRESWWRNRAILILNICLILPLLSSTLNGFDLSMINNLARMARVLS
ncbi:uncharacterized protein F5147DRAFT_723982 [Suillus discolor]|uniref:Uncharacterized protein n=1 Tax=Suillus discolor TaxID=1912936 RepID=A0A9P7JMP2_9AGAM|nr:uncharacterized protein F5147DRAFT_723982 [Suillus discolor]KAG2091206.1 hypothetical protein F5147DRAFT_723982 [Suillus discolor]